MTEKKYTTVLIDLDGTISNTFSGVSKCLIKTCEKFGADYTKFNMRKFIGPPLNETFKKLFNDRETEELALPYYRSLYLEDGIFDNQMYEGIDEFAAGLQKRGVLVGVATSKFEKFAIEVLKKLGMLNCLDFVCGSEEGRVQKSEIINFAIEKYHIEKDKCLMIGDTFYDLRGAQASGIDAVGVLYGFGEREELVNYPNIGIVETMDDLKEFVYKKV